MRLSCHGIFGESREVFSPIVGGTTKEDVRTGRVARLTDAAYPERTTLMKLNTLSTLWDFINRAMPWTAPKSLTPDEVYAVTAFILNLASVVPDDYVLSNSNIAEAQKLLPNRNGMTTAHGMWPGKEIGHGKPDVQGSACMVNCTTETKVASILPEFARNAHGNLAEQNRLVGPQRGADTTRPADPAPVGSGVARPAAAGVAAGVGAKAAGPAPAALAMLQRNNCLACHGVDNKIVGPAFREVAGKHAARPDALAYLVGKIKAGGAGVWGSIPMPPQTLSDDEAKAIASGWSMGPRSDRA